MLSLDTETTGVDLYHGAKPYLVTVCRDGAAPEFWEWDVDPLTREPSVPPADLKEIREVLETAAGWARTGAPDPDDGPDALRERHVLVFQNPKFDAAALATLGLTDFPWPAVRDTLMAGHLLASNRPHDLTSMAVQYLGVDIEPVEKKLKKACEEARRYCRSRLPDWHIAKEGDPSMPSVRSGSKRGEEKPWKNDGWLPRALVKHWWESSEARETWARERMGGVTPEATAPSYRNLPGWEYRPPDVEDGDHPYWTVLSDYAAADSAATVALWKVMRKEIGRRKLWKIYRERLKVLPVVAEMERRGVSLSAARLRELTEEYRADSARAARICVNIAATYESVCDACGGTGRLPEARPRNRTGRKKSRAKTAERSGATVPTPPEPTLFPCEACGGKGSGPYKLEVPKSGNNLSLRRFVFGPLGLPPLKESAKTGEPSFDKGTVDEYEERLPPHSKQLRFVQTLKVKRKRDTALSYMEGYDRFWLPYLDRAKKLELSFRPPAGTRQGPCVTFGDFADWRVLHPNLNPTGTDTLRFSCSNPNEQNISKQGMPCFHCKGDGCDECGGKGVDSRSLRYCFGPAPGREWWSFDGKNLELRIPAYKANERAMIELFERPDDPPYYGSNHLLNFSVVYPEIWAEELEAVGFEKVGPHCKKKYEATWYKYCKNGGFSKQYGGQRAKTDTTFRRAGAYDLMESRFAGLTGLNRRCIRFAEEHGYVETEPDRTVDPTRGYPILCTRTEYGKILPTVPLNYYVQGCLDGSCRVQTTEGLIPIRNLVNREVTVWTGFRWARAVGLERGACQRVDVTLSSGLKIKCDARHKLKNENDQWVDVKDVRVGDYVALPINRDPLEASEKVNWWFLLGFIIGDGALSDRADRKCLDISGGIRKKGVLEALMRFLRDEEGYTGNKDKYRDRGGVRWRVIPASNNRQEKYVVSLENQEFATKLESYGVDFSWRFDTKRIPAAVWAASPQDRRDFLEGLWLSDGSRAANSGSGYRLNMNNQSLLEEVQVLASGVGYDSRLTNGSLCFRWRAFNSKSRRKYPAAAVIRQVDGVERSEYEDAGEFATDKRNFSLASKGVDISQYVAERILQKNSRKPAAYRYDRVVSVDYLGREEVTYTMAVDDPLHQFVADGVIHPNTAMWWMMKAMLRVAEFFGRLNRGETFAGRKWPGGYYIAMQVHDELDVDMPAGPATLLSARGGDENGEARAASLDDGPAGSRYNRPVAREVRRLMELGGGDIGVPTTVSMEYHEKYWSEGVVCD